MRLWNDGFDALSAVLRDLQPSDLKRVVHIRKQPLSVEDALLRSLAHTAFHIGQMVTIAKETAPERWICQSIERGRSEEYNKSHGM